jgi:hypothetical protein
LTSFWCYAWCGHSSWKDKFPEIYNICREQEIIVADADAFNWGFTFKRWMPPDVIEQMHGLLILLRHITLNEEQDKPFWKCTKSGKFTVKSIYITCATI